VRSRDPQFGPNKKKEKAGHDFASSGNFIGEKARYLLKKY
jgi:hypothetical protein